MALYVLPSGGAGNTSASSASATNENPNGLPEWLWNIEKTISDSADHHPMTGIPGSGSGFDNVGSDIVNIATGNYQGNKNGTNPYSGDFASPSNDEEGIDKYDETGFDQATWQFEKYLELLADQRAYNSAEAEKTRQWQERMSNTAYQRATEDLKKAGLNKWLAVTGGANGASASTPSGATASSSLGSASVPNPAIYKAIIQFLESITKSAFSLFDFF